MQNKSVCRRICGSREECEAILAKLKTTACPHCKRVGNLIRHGCLRGYDEEHPRQKTVRAWRIFCSNRKRATGCGRTFSVWTADKVKRLLLTADALWTFLKQAVVSGNKFQAFRNLKSGLSCYRLHSDRSLGVILTEQSSKFDCLITPAIRQSPAPRLLYPAPRIFVKTSYPAQPRPFFRAVAWALRFDGHPEMRLRMATRAE